MTALEAYRDLQQIGRPVITTAEAAARWKSEQRTAGKRLKRLEATGLLRRLRAGRWAVDPNLDPFIVAPYLTAPYPAYISLWSALAHHGMIEQIPRPISVASLARTRKIETSVGIYEIHRLAPELFGGYEGSDQAGYVATAEKALFDTIYVRAAAGSRAYLPELVIPEEFERAELKRWVDRIESPRLRTLVRRQVRSVLKQARAIERV